MFKKTKPTPSSSRITLQPPEVTLDIEKTGNPPKEGYREHYPAEWGSCTFTPAMNEFIQLNVGVKFAVNEPNARFVSNVRVSWFIDNTTIWSNASADSSNVQASVSNPAVPTFIPFVLPSHRDAGMNIVCNYLTPKILIEYKLRESSIWNTWYTTNFEYSRDIWSAFETITTGDRLVVNLSNLVSSSATAQNQIPYTLTTKSIPPISITNVSIVPFTAATSSNAAVYKFSYGSIQDLQVKMVRLPFLEYNGYVALQKNEVPNNYLCYSNGAFSEVANWSDDCFFSFALPPPPAP
jgi:hypothetical protein